MDRTRAGVCLLAAAVYVNTLGAGFVYDDRRAVLTNPDVVTSTPLQDLLSSDFWGTPLRSSNSHGSYRPLCVLTFRINYLINGLNPSGYHLVNIVLHSVATGLVLEVGRIVLPRRCPAVAAFLFAVLPVHTEAVAGIVGRADILACIFYLLSFIMFSKHVSVRERLVCLDFNCKSRLKTFTESANTASDLVTRELCADFTVKGNSDGFRAIALLFLSVGFAVCATLCKETGATVLAVCAVYDVLLLSNKRFKYYFQGPSRRFSLLTLAASSCLLLSLRLHLMGARLPAFAKSDNPTAHDPSVITRSLTFLYLPVENFKLFVYPRWLSFDWSMDSISSVTNVFDTRNILTLLFYYIIYRVVKLSWLNCSKHSELVEECRKVSNCNKRCRLRVSHVVHSTACCKVNNNNTVHCCDCARITTRGSVLLCLVFLIVPFLPASNLPFYVGFVMAERVLYLPSIGYCFLFSVGWKILSCKLNRRTLEVLLFLLLLVSGVRSWQRNKDWADEESLYRSGIPVNPAKAYGNLGSVLSSQGRMQEAEAALRMALWHRPNMADVHYNLGNLQRGLKRFDDAILSYKMAINIRPSLAVAYLNLGHLLASLENYTEAEDVLRKCSRLDSAGLKDLRAHQVTKTTALLHLGRLYFERGKFHDAVDVLMEAVNTKPAHYQPQTLYGLLAEALEKTDRRAEAVAWYKAASIDSELDSMRGSYLLKNRTTTLES